MPIDIDNINPADPRDERDEFLERNPRQTMEERVAKAFQPIHRELADLLHPNPTFASAAFIRLLEPPRETERPTTVAIRGGDRERVIDPYVDRVLQCARRFRALARGARETVVNGMRSGIPWRGDDIGFYLRVLDESERMTEMGVDSYRREAMAKLGGLLHAR
jgi:hypothetical protein